MVKNEYRHSTNSAESQHWKDKRVEIARPLKGASRLGFKPLHVIRYPHSLAAHRGQLFLQGTGHDHGGDW
jgi:hypothetical protein